MQPPPIETPHTRDQRLLASAMALGKSVVEARKDFATFFELVGWSPENTAVQVQDFQRGWLHHLNSYRRVLLLAPRGHGKCMVEGSLVLAANGRRVPIEAWKGEDVIAYDDADLNFVRAPSRPAVYNGVQPCVRVRTRTGRVEVVTRNHRFATVDGWVFAEDLRVGDRIAVARRTLVGDAVDLPERDAWLLGLFVGNGTMTSSHAGVCLPDPEVHKTAVQLFKQRSWRVTPQQDPRSVELAAEEACQERPRDWLRRHGLYGCGAYEKRVPQDVFRQVPETIAHFLAGYLEADGSVNPLRGGAVEYYSVSEDLLRDTQHLLTRGGIVSVLSRKNGRYLGERHRSWRLTIRGSEIVGLAAWLPVCGRKTRALQAIAKQATRQPNSVIDVLPRSVYDWLPHSPWWGKSRGLTTYDRKYELSRGKARTLAAEQDCRRLRDVVDAPIFWDQVVEVESAGRRRTWGLEVPRYHSYLSGHDVVHHNSEFVTLRVLWELGRDPNLRVKIVCQSDDRAKRVLTSLKKHITSNRLLHLVFPGLKRDPNGAWTDTKIDLLRPGVPRDPSIHALGVLSTVVGGRSDLLWFDDPMDYRMIILQPKTGKAAVAKTFAEWMPTLVPTGRVWVTMTPWGESDLAGVLRTRKGWALCENAVGTDDDPFVPLWPARFSRQYLMELRESEGAIDYDRAYRLKLVSEDVVPVRPKWIRYYDNKLLGNPDNYFCVVSFDLAISQAATADYFAYSVVLYDADRNLSFVVDAQQGRYTFQEQVDIVLTTAKSWNADRVVIEKAMYEGALAQLVEAKADWPIPVVTVKPKVKKVRRLIEVTPRLENERIYFHPKLNPKNYEGEELIAFKQRGDLITQLTTFPGCTNDDLVDSFVQAEQSIREVAVDGSPGAGEVRVYTVGGDSPVTATVA